MIDFTFIVKPNIWIDFTFIVNCGVDIQIIVYWLRKSPCVVAVETRLSSYYTCICVYVYRALSLGRTNTLT